MEHRFNSGGALLPTFEAALQVNEATVEIKFINYIPRPPKK